MPAAIAAFIVTGSKLAQAWPVLTMLICLPASRSNRSTTSGLVGASPGIPQTSPLIVPPQYIGAAPAAAGSVSAARERARARSSTASSDRRLRAPVVSERFTGRESVA